MRKIKYILKKLKTLQYKEMIRIARIISKKIHKPTVYILFDMIRCAFKFGSGYMDYFEFEFYLLNDDERATYITSSINNEIIRKYNDKSEIHKLSNKNEFNGIFKKYLNREYIYLKDKSIENFKEFIKDKNKICVKPVDDCGGKGVEILNVNSESSKTIYDSLIKNNQLLVEEVIKQHESINKLYSKSINTLRIITFLTDDGHVEIMKSIFKIGNNTVTDNFSSGGMYTFTDEDGKVFVSAIDEKGNIYDKHPVTNESIIGFQIPMYSDVKKIVKEMALMVPKIRYIGWDIAISQNGPVVVEGNEFSGIFQVKPSISGIKTGDKPNYKKFMDI